jgi:hypothetical protein
MNSEGNNNSIRERRVRPVKIGCVVALLVAILLPIVTYYVVFKEYPTVYAKGYTETKFKAIKTGMTDKQVNSILGAPLTITQEIVFTKGLPQNRLDSHYCSFINGIQVSASPLLDLRSKRKQVSSIREAINILTPQERKLATLKYRWDYADGGGSGLSANYQIRNVTFNARRIVIDKYSGEWVD